MTLKKLTYKSKERYLSNPFLDKVAIKHEKKFVKNQTDRVIVNTDGQVEGKTAVYRLREFKDTEQFIKVYTDKLSLWLDLSSRARKILNYIMQNVKKDTDQVTLDIEQDHIKVATGYTSKASLYGGLDELIDRQIIAKARWKDVFYINPSFMFNGNRATFIERIERKNGRGTKVEFTGGRVDNKLRKELTEFQDDIDRIK